VGTRIGRYYGWYIACSAATLLLVTNSLTLSGLAVYDESLLRTLQESTGQTALRGPLKFRDLITFWGSGILAPLAGAFADRVGVRPLMVIGLALLSAAYFAYGHVTSLGQIYAIHVLLALTLATCGLLVNVILVSRWFVRGRGLALGITLAGTSLGNALFPPLNAYLIEHFGWRSAFESTSLIPLALIPIVLFIIRERPSDKGLVPPGDQTDSRGAGVSQYSGLTIAEALKSINFWVLALIAMCTFYSVLAVTTNLQLHMRSQGFSPQTAAAGSSVLFATGLVGKLLSGQIAESLGRKRIFVGTLALMAIGAWFVTWAGPSSIWAALFCFGLGWGGLYTLLQLLAADSFGIRHLGPILGTITVLDTFGGGLGPYFTGLMYDRTGSYTIPFTVIASLVTLAFVLSTQLRTDKHTVKT
jgi:MFS family permease